MTTITLFQFESCPYCAKVRAKLDELGLKYEKKEMPRDREDPARVDLKAKSGVATVPVIKIGEKYMGESDAIVAYLEKHHKEL